MTGLNSSRSFETNRGDHVRARVRRQYADRQAESPGSTTHKETQRHGPRTRPSLGVRARLLEARYGATFGREPRPANALATPDRRPRRSGKLNEMPNRLPGASTTRGDAHARESTKTARKKTRPSSAGDFGFRAADRRVAPLRIRPAGPPSRAPAGPGPEPGSPWPGPVGPGQAPERPSRGPAVRRPGPERGSPSRAPAGPEPGRGSPSRAPAVRRPGPE